MITIGFYSLIAGLFALFYTLFCKDRSGGENYEALLWYIISFILGGAGLLMILIGWLWQVIR